MSAQQQTSLLIDYVNGFEQAVKEGTNSKMTEAYDAAIGGLQIIGDLHAVLIDSVASIGCPRLMKFIYKITGVAKHEPISTVIHTLHALHEAVFDYRAKFMCHPKVRLCNLPEMIPESAKFERINEPDMNLNAHKSGPSKTLLKRIETKRIVLDKMSDKIGAVLHQLVHMWSFASNARNIEEQCTPLGPSNAICLELRLNKNITEIPGSQTPEHKVKAQLKEYVLNYMMQMRYCKEQDKQNFGNEKATFVTRVCRTAMGVSTGCYTRIMPDMTVFKFVALVLNNSKEEAIRTLMAGRDNDMVTYVAKSLATNPDKRFPAVIVDHTLYAYENGIFNASALTFTKYEHETTALLRNAEVQNDEEYERLMKLVDAHNAKINGVTDDELVEGLRKAGRSPRIYLPYRFDPKIIKKSQTPQGLQELEPPELRTILESQGLGFDVRMEVYALLGRSMFPREVAKDAMKIALYFVGCAGTGKSTLIDVLLQFIPFSEVGVLEAVMEEVFWAQDLADKSITIASEFPKTLSTDILCKMITGDPVTVACKGKGHIKLPSWISPIIIASNRFFRYGNEAGQISRRFAIVNFPNMVTKRDENIVVALKSNPAVVQMIFARCYDNLCQERGREDYYLNAHKYFLEQNTLRFVSSNPLASFIYDKAYVTLTPDGAQFEYYVEWVEFKAKCNEFSRSGSRISLQNADDYTSILNRCGLKIVSDFRFDYKLDKDRGSVWLIGCALTEGLETMVEKVKARLGMT